MTVEPRYVYFWHTGRPLVVTFEIEKVVRTLLARHTRDGGRSFVREHTGDWNERQTFANDDALLADLRKFYHWDITRNTYPHSPPEQDARTLILGRLASR